MPDMIFEYRRNGEDSGFMAWKDKDYVFKPDRNSAVILPLEVLKKNLRLLVKQKKARLIKAGTVEAVAVPRELFDYLFA